MIEKYSQLDIYEIENGFILKYIPKDNPNNTNVNSFISIYYRDVDSLTKKIKELLQNE